MTGEQKEVTPPTSDQTTNQKEPTWSGELRRRARHLRGLLEAEEANPSHTEPWKLKLIQKALFSTWLDRRNLIRCRGDGDSNLMTRRDMIRRFGVDPGRVIHIPREDFHRD